MHRQQVQPHSIIFIIVSQHDWIIAQHFASMLVHIMQTPSGIISILHMPIVMLQFIIIMPFIIMQQLTMLPDIILQRFCSIAAAVSSEHLQSIFMPPSHFSSIIVQRGIIIMFMDGTAPAMPPLIIPAIGDMPIAPRSIVIIVFIFRSQFCFETRHRFAA